MENQSNSNNSAWEIGLYVGLLILLAYGIKWLYGEQRVIFNTIIIGFNKVLLWPISLIPGTLAHKAFHSSFQWHNPGKYHWREMVLLTEASAHYYRWPMLIYGIYLTIRTYKKYGLNEIFTTVFNMETLMQNNVKVFPCMAPVAWRKLIDEPLDAGPWRVARTPLQFAVEHGLIVDGAGELVPKDLLLNTQTGFANAKSPLLEFGKNKGVHLERAKAEAIVSRQLGQPFESFEGLPDYVKGLAAAFVAFGCGDKKGGQDMLDKMSLSFVEARGDQPMKLDTSGAAELYRRYESDPMLQHAVRNHTSYVTVWLCALLMFARRKGVIACSQFVWLRPVDRTLWYSLNQMGGRAGWAEALGVWAHYQLEELVRNPVSIPDLELAIDGLEQELIATGFLEEKRKERTRPVNSSHQPIK